MRVADKGGDGGEVVVVGDTESFKYFDCGCRTSREWRWRSRYMLLFFSGGRGSRRARRRRRSGTANRLHSRSMAMMLSHRHWLRAARLTTERRRFRRTQINHTPRPQRRQRCPANRRIRPPRRPHQRIGNIPIPPNMLRPTRQRRRRAIRVQHRGRCPSFRQLEAAMYRHVDKLPYCCEQLPAKPEHTIHLQRTGPLISYEIRRFLRLWDEQTQCM